VYGSKDFEITPLKVTVTANTGQTKVYGTADPALFTYQYTPELVTGDTFSGALSRDPGTNVGLYAITQGDLALSANYELTFVSKNFEITKATPTATLSLTPVSVIYSGVAQTPVVSIVTSSTPGAISNVKYNGSATAPKNVGVYAVTADFVPTDTANYNTLTAVSAGNFEITAAHPALLITVTPNKTAFYAVGNVITYTYVLQNTGDVTLIGPFTVADNKVTPVTCPATPTSLAHDATITCTGSYTITAADLKAGKLINTAAGAAVFDGVAVTSSSVDTTIVTKRLFFPIIGK
jgi:hypothetical protein